MGNRTPLYKQEPPCNHSWCNKNNRDPALAEAPVYYIDHNIYIVITMYIRRAYGSSIVRPKMSYIPRSMGLLLRFTWIFVLSNIDKVVWSVVQIFVDHKRSFPRWGQLVHISLILDEPEHQIAFLKSSDFNPAVVIMTQVLLVNRRTSRCNITLLI